MAVIDSFMYFNEAAVCTLRLSLLRDAVDRFVVVEGTHSFTGKARGLQFPADVLTRLKDDPTLLAKIDYQPVDLSPLSGAGSPWERERYLRDAISNFVDDEESVVLVSDCDEVPSIRWVVEARARQDGDHVGQHDRQAAIAHSICSAEMLLFYGTLRNLVFSETGRPVRWTGPFSTSAGLLKHVSPHTVRESIMRGEPVLLPDGSHCPVRVLSDSGWHLSYFGDNRLMGEKLTSFSHQEEAIQAYAGQIGSSLRRGADPFMRPYRMRLPLPEEMVRVGPIDAELASELGMPEFSLEYLQAAAALRVLDRLAFIEQRTQEELSLARADLADATHELADARQEFAHARQELAELRALIELTNHRVEDSAREHQVTVARLVEARQQATAMLEAIQASHSWRATGPLRVAGRWVRDITHRQ